MGSSNYVTFGEFNNERQPVHMSEQYPFGTGMNSSMELYDNPQNDMYSLDKPSSFERPQKYPIRQHVQYPRNPYNVHMNENNIETFSPPPRQQLELNTHSITPIQQALSPPPSPSPRRENYNPFGQTCVDINDHIVNCPICSQYYKSYGSMYVGIIILLGFIILIFLLKSIMEIKR